MSEADGYRLPVSPALAKWLQENDQEIAEAPAAFFDSTGQPRKNQRKYAR